MTSSGPAEGVAIVGMAVRVPGAATLDQLWRNLIGGVESLTRFTAEELIAAGADPAVVADPDYVPVRGVLPGIEEFDSTLFGYPPREAELMDPQQRVFLQCAWQALEDAAIRPAGRSIGVFAGSGLNTYLIRHVLSRPDLESTLGLLTLMLTNDKDQLATRVAYKMDLRGPAVAVQSACSTSLAALHLAAQSLVRGECDAALAGGVRILLPQTSGYLFEQNGISSPDGRCRPFDADAHGTVTGNGCGVVVLRRLADALADGDRIYAVIRGSAMNNDGADKVGYSAPSVAGQRAVVRAALDAAGVSAETIGYVEAHGTGTEVGDAIEVAALTEAYAADTGKRGYCGIGSLKGNLGHLDAASGVLGLVKAALALSKEVIPPSINVTRPNPEISFETGPFYVNLTATPWPRGESPRRCGVSSFGVGGTNVHVILEDAPAVRREPVAEAEGPWLLAFSAASEPALAEMGDRLADHLDRHPEVALSDVEATLRRGRTVLPYRTAIATSDRRGLRLRFSATPVQRSRRPRTVALLFPGQGAQRPGMLAGLPARFPELREIVDHCLARLSPQLGRDLGPALLDPDAEVDLSRTELAQPALFVTEYALARLLQRWGVRPTVLMGHSLGELTAACLGGALRLDDALDLVTARGRAMGGTAEGAMLAVAAPADDIAPLLDADLSIAALNGPRSIVVSGPAASVTALQSLLAGQGRRVKLLSVRHGFHSALMDPALAEVDSAAAAVHHGALSIPVVANLTGATLASGTTFPAGYWPAHARRPVRFGEGLSRVLASPTPALIEVGPGTALTALAYQQENAQPPTVIATLGEPGTAAANVQAVIESAGALWAAGFEVDLDQATGGSRGRRIALPGYPFERHRHWLTPGRPAPTAVPAVPAETAGPGGPEPGRDAVAELAGLWQELLGVPAVGAGDNFFALGGQSLLAVRLVARIKKVFGATLSLSDVLEAPTLAELAEVVQHHRSDEWS